MKNRYELYAVISIQEDGLAEIDETASENRFPTGRVFDKETNRWLADSEVPVDVLENLKTMLDDTVIV